MDTTACGIHYIVISLCRKIQTRWFKNWRGGELRITDIEKTSGERRGRACDVL